MYRGWRQHALYRTYAAAESAPGALMRKESHVEPGRSFGTRGAQQRPRRAHPHTDSAGGAGCGELRDRPAQSRDRSTRSRFYCRVSRGTGRWILAFLQSLRVSGIRIELLYPVQQQLPPQRSVGNRIRRDGEKCGGRPPGASEGQRHGLPACIKAGRKRSGILCAVDPAAVHFVSKECTSLCQSLIQGTAAGLFFTIRAAAGDDRDDALQSQKTKKLPGNRAGIFKSKI